ncbi:MAG TPA: dihydropteroate synthase [Desulfomonilia bacterium]|nr:dihydropteroate synthase [Desulfomonilia bacterium]
MPQSRLLCDADGDILLSCGVDPASLPYMVPKLNHVNLLVRGVKLYAANILKQSMLSIGGDVAVHRHVISGKVETSDCVIMGDLRHFRLLVNKLELQPGLEPLVLSIREQVFPEKGPLKLTLCSRKLTWTELPVIVGILNVTPDSFSDGGRFLDPDSALEHAHEMVGLGAEIIDVGGESSRPGSQNVDALEEISRISPVIRQLASSLEIPVSIDTTKAVVAEEALKAGASIINDISALRDDPDMMSLAREHGCGVILMHMRGTPKTMQDNTIYKDIISEIYTFLDERIEMCLDAGISPDSIIIDPGLGFGKDLHGNLSILRHISEFKSLHMPLLVGHSRKTFIGKIINGSIDEREEGTDTVTAWAALNGVDMVRVHNCLHAKRVRSVMNSIAGA